MSKNNTLENPKINVKIKLAALWTSVMFLYAYADIQHFVLQPGSLDEIIKGTIAGVEITSIFLVGAAVLMTIPSVMIFLSIALKPNLNRWINIIFGSIFTLLSVMTWVFPDGTWAYYIFYNVVESVLTSLVVWYAITWPKQET